MFPTQVEVSSLTPDKCIQACRERGFSFAGVQYSRQCFCGNTAPPLDKIVDKNECNKDCEGDPAIKCGGHCRMNVYRTGEN